MSVNDLIRTYIHNIQPHPKMYAYLSTNNDFVNDDHYSSWLC